jgi:hypothetical protein
MDEYAALSRVRALNFLVQSRIGRKVPLSAGGRAGGMTAVAQQPAKADRTIVPGTKTV